MKTQSITLLALWASIAMAAPYKSFGDNTEAPSTPEIPANGEDLPDTHSLGLDLVGGKLGEDRAGLGLALGALNDNVEGAGHGLNLDVGKLAEDRGGLELDLGKFGENGGDKHGLGLDMGKIGENKEGLSLELGKLTEGGEGIGRGVNLDIGKLGEDKAGISLDIGKFGDNIDTSGLNLDIGKLGEDKFGLDLSIGKFGQKIGDKLRERFHPSTVTVYVPVAAPCTAGNVALPPAITKFPNAGIQGDSIPSAAVPSAAVPSAAVPSAGAPSAGAPSAAAPSAAAPSAAAPSADVPNVNPLGSLLGGGKGGSCNAKQAIADPSFENAGSWLQLDAKAGAEALVLLGDALNPAHSGLRNFCLRLPENGEGALLTLATPISLCAGINYNFEAFYRIPKTESGCRATFSIGGQVVAEANAVAEWTSVRGVYTAAKATVSAALEAQLQVSVTCTGGAPGPKEIFLDDITLTPVGAPQVEDAPGVPSYGRYGQY